MDEQLRPCPLCGGADFGLSWGATGTPDNMPPDQICDIMCRGCGLRLWGNCTPVAAKWNTRPTQKDDK